MDAGGFERAAARFGRAQALRAPPHHGFVLLKDHSLILHRFELEVACVTGFIANIWDVGVEESLLRTLGEPGEIHALSIGLDADASGLRFLHCRA